MFGFGAFGQYAFGQSHPAATSTNLSPHVLTNVNSFGTGDKETDVLHPVAFGTSNTFGVPKEKDVLYQTRFANSNSFGVERETDVLHPTRLLNASTFGVPKEGLVAYQARLGSGNSFGFDKETDVLYATRFSNAASFGSPKTTIIVHPVDLASANFYHVERETDVLHPHVQLQINGFGVPYIYRPMFGHDFVNRQTFFPPTVHRNGGNGSQRKKIRLPRKFSDPPEIVAKPKPPKAPPPPLVEGNLPPINALVLPPAPIRTNEPPAWLHQHQLDAQDHADAMHIMAQLEDDHLQEVKHLLAELQDLHDAKHILSALA